MKVSLKWLNEYVDVPADLKAFCDRLDLTGTGVEGVEKTGAAFDNVVTAQVVSKQPHPDSDHMWLCKVDVGDKNLGEDGNPVKLPEPLFGPRDDYSEHQRDPKVIYNEEKQMYYILIGAQTLDKKGTILIYKSKELLSGWTFAGQLNVPGYDGFGGMWECPYIVNISGKDLLIFSPQYTKLPGRAESTNHNVYLIGTMDYDTLTFTPDSDSQYLDFGYDF